VINQNDFIALFAPLTKLSKDGAVLPMRMANYDPTELIRLCESILQDGEISSDEVYELSQWLNDHREACFQWPGDQLVAPLQSAWDDGKINKTELRTIAALLRRILKDWAKYQTEVSLEYAADFADEILSSLNVYEPRLPAIPIVIRVKSYTTKGILYDVDLTGPSCTCPDWRSHRQEFPAGHLTRCCKHVFDAYSRFEPQLGWPSWIGAFLNVSWPAHPKQEWQVLAWPEPVLISNAPNLWANAFVPDNASYERYGYNVVEQRWAYGMAPDRSFEIIQAIESM
jgi:hypothetical protein